MVRKVIIVDRSNASPIITLNVENNVFPPGSYDGSPLEDKLTEREGGPHTPPDSKLTLIEGPPGTNVLVQGPPDSEIHLIEGPPGTNVLVEAPPSSEIVLIEGPPGIDYPVEAPPGADVFEGQSPPPDSFQDSYSEPEEINASPGE